MNQLSGLPAPSTSAEPVFAPLSEPPTELITSAAVPFVAVSFIIRTSCCATAGFIARSARAIGRPSSSGATSTGWRKTPVRAVAVIEATFSGFMVICPCPMYAAAAEAPAASGTLPSAERMPVFQSSPIPKTSRASFDRAASSWTSSIRLMKAVLQDRAKAVANAASPGRSKFFRLWKERPPQEASLVHCAGWSTAALPRSISIAAVTIFIVEPGARAPSIAALKPSLRWLATARMCPLLGLTATTEASG